MRSATFGPTSDGSRSRFWRVFTWLITAVVLIVAAGALFQLGMTLWESRRYPAPGKLVDIGGLRSRCT